jgi:hypothetical protein
MLNQLIRIIHIIIPVTTASMAMITGMDQLITIQMNEITKISIVKMVRTYHIIGAECL